MQTPSNKNRTNRNTALATGIPTFPHLSVETCNIETAIQLLYSSEKNVVNDAIIALNRFGMHSNINLIELFNCHILEALRHLLINNDNDEEIVKFTLKLLALLIRLPEVIEHLNTDEIFIIEVIKLIKDTKDEIFHEYCTAILACLTENIEVARIVYDNELLNPIWQHIKCQTDLDTTNSCLKILTNILQLNAVIKELLLDPSFKLEPIIVLFTNEYVALGENALQLCKKITCTEECGEQLFDIIKKTAQFFEKLLELLESTQFVAFYQTVLEIFEQTFKWPRLILYFIENEYLPRFLKYAEENTNLDLVTVCIDIIVKVASIDNGRHELYRLCIENFLMKYIMKGDTDTDEIIALKACEAVNAMVKHPKAVKEFINVPFLRTICSLLPTKQGVNVWPTGKLFIIEALTYIIWSDVRVPEILIDPSIFSFFLITIEMNVQIIPVEYYCKLLRLMQPFALCQKWYDAVDINLKLLELLRAQLNNSNDDIKICVLEILSTFLRDELRINWCLANNCYLIPVSYLESENDRVVFAAIEFINHLCKYKNIAYAYIKNNLLTILQKRKHTFQHYPIWQRTIDYLFNTHLSSKFHCRGALDVTDITDDYFYVSKRVINEFPILEDLLKDRLNPRETLFVVQLKCQKPPVEKLKRWFSELDVSDFEPDTKRNTEINEQRQYQSTNFITKESQLNEIDAKSKTRPKTRDRPKQTICKRYRALLQPDNEISNDEKTTKLPVDTPCNTKLCTYAKFEALCPRLMSWLSCLPPDPYLIDYIKYLKRKCNYLNLLERIKYLAHFIVRVMSGPDSQNLYLTKNAQFEHLNQLKRKYNTSIIPLGFIRIGSYLERAMLFKVLADRLQIPCTFVRGKNQGIAWNEIPLVTTDKKQLNLSDEGPLIFYVVDLMSSPGTLYPKNTASAINYCTTNTGFIS